MTEQPAKCPDCQVDPGQPHDEGCDVARCPICGMQRIQCEEHEFAEVFSIWTGRWPGLAECERLGWYCYWDDQMGWVPCAADHPDAVADVNRLRRAARAGGLMWSRDRQEWIHA